MALSSAMAKDEADAGAVTQLLDNTVASVKARTNAVDQAAYNAVSRNHRELMTAETQAMQDMAQLSGDARTAVEQVNFDASQNEKKAVQSMDMQFHKLKQQFDWSEQQEKNNVKAQAENSEMALQYALGKTSQTAAGLKRVDDKFEAAALDAGAALNSSG